MSERWADIRIYFVPVVLSTFDQTRLLATTEARYEARRDQRVTTNLRSIVRPGTDRRRK